MYHVQCTHSPVNYAYFKAEFCNCQKLISEKMAVTIMGRTANLEVYHRIYALELNICGSADFFSKKIFYFLLPQNPQRRH